MSNPNIGIARNLKIAIAGPQGSGKTTLMQAMVDNHGFNKLQVQTKDSLPDGVFTHLDVLRMAVTNPTQGIDFQKNLIEKRKEVFKASCYGFVSDRSVIDSLAYYAAHNAPFASKEIDEYLHKLAYEAISELDVVVLLRPVLRKQVEDNALRTTSSTYYQAMSAVIGEFVIDAALSDLKETYHAGKARVYVTNSGTMVIDVIELNGMLTSEDRINIILSAINVEYSSKGLSNE